MPRVFCLALVLAAVPARAAELPRPIVTGLKNPESVAVGPDRRVYVSVIGEFDTDGDGAVLVVDKGKAVPFASGLNDPKGLIAFGEFLFVTDKDRVLRINRAGKATVLAAAAAFPRPPVFLNDIDVDEAGQLYVSDTGDPDKGGGALFRVDQKGKVTLVSDGKKAPALRAPNGVQMDGMSFVLVSDFATGQLHRVKVADGSAEKVAEGFGGADGVVFDKFGRLFLSDHSGGKVFGIARPGEKPVLVAEGFQSAADGCIDPTGKVLLVPDMKAGTLTPLPAQVPGFEVDTSPLPLESEIAFPDLKWTGWKNESDTGKIIPLRPIVLTHAGDGSGRVFVATQHGVIHVFEGDQKAASTKVFLDLQDRVKYSDDTNEEGFLGLAFHPDYKKNGELYVFYTVRKGKLTNVLSRFKVSKDDPDRADPGSEEVLLTVERPFWNHDGGTVIFGPDGYLYLALGDGGAANDPFDNGQRLRTLLGKVLRIDVGRKEDGKAYAVPKDNPFVGRKDALPEIWCYGLRNVWRMAFDPQTKVLWAGEVGQNLYEEINLLRAGGNYGWNRRESLHPFGNKGVGPRPDLIEPIWEYHHDVGKSITGGLVYRGSRLPALAGHYVYADYVSAKIWALRYDESKKRVTANRPIRDRGLPVLSFGEDEKGEVYYMTYTPTGQGIYRFTPTKQGR